MIPRQRAQMNASCRIVVDLVLLAVVPVIVVLVTEKHKTFLIWRIRIVDFADLILLAPFYLIVLYRLHREFAVGRAGSREVFLSFALTGLFLYGHAMHVTANAVNTYSTEIHDYISRIPSDSYELLFFFDEKLGHVLLFSALFSLLGLWMWLEHRHPGESLSRRLVVGVSGAGLLHGVSMAIALIESTQPVLGYLACVGLLALATVTLVDAKGDDFRASLICRPLTLFVLCSASSILVTQSVYYFVAGGFLEPSQLLGP